MDFSNNNIKKARQDLSSSKKKVTSKILVSVFKVFIVLVVFAAVTMSSMVFGAINGIIKTAPKITMLHHPSTKPLYMTVTMLRQRLLLRPVPTEYTLLTMKFPITLKMLLSQLRMSVSFPTTELMQKEL